MELDISRQFFEGYSNVKLHENPSSGSRVVNAVRRQDRQTDMTKLIVVFCNFANAPKEMFQGKQGSSLPSVTPYLYSL